MSAVDRKPLAAARAGVCPFHAAAVDDAANDPALPRLIAGPVVERELPEESPLRRTVTWVREFLARPHPELGRPGPVCPYTPAALNLGTLWLAEVPESDPAPEKITAIINAYRDRFLEIEPKTGNAAINKAFMVVFPNLGPNGAATVDRVQAELKPLFVAVGLMLGEFHATNESPGLRNPEFRPLRSPIPMLAIRYMVESDLPFLKRTIDAPELRSAFVRSYLRRLGGAMKPNNFDQAIDALVDAEIERRCSAGMLALTGKDGDGQA